MTARLPTAPRPYSEVVNAMPTGRLAMVAEVLALVPILASDDAFSASGAELLGGGGMAA